MVKNLCYQCCVTNVELPPNTEIWLAYSPSFCALKQRAKPLSIQLWSSCHFFVVISIRGLAESIILWLGRFVALCIISMGLTLRGRDA